MTFGLTQLANPVTVALTATGLPVPTAMMGGIGPLLAPLGAAAAGIPAGLLLLKGAAILGFYIGANEDKGYYTKGYSHGGYHRRKRSAATAKAKEEAAFDLVVDIEPEECYHRLICDLGTGHLRPGQYDVIAALFNQEYDQETAAANYKHAYIFGKVMKSIKTCEMRYRCPFSGEQINQQVL